jgi:hypothetical protein
LGYGFLNIGADVLGLRQYCQSIMAAVTKRATGENKSGASGFRVGSPNMLGSATCRPTMAIKQFG